MGAREIVVFIAAICVDFLDSLAGPISFGRVGAAQWEKLGQTLLPTTTIYNETELIAAL